MEFPVTTRVALLQALRNGPGYGLELIRRVGRMTDGELRLSPGRVYPVLDTLASEGLVTARRVSPKGLRGARSRTYYELTTRGLSTSTAQRRLLAAIVDRAAAPLPDEAERARMAGRLAAAEEMAALGASLERAMRRAR